MPAAEADTVPFHQAAGRVLHQSVVADRDQPPFDRVTMDGIAIAFSDFDSGTREFPIQARQDAGEPVLTLDAGHCVEIMTGASLPKNADCVVPVERTSVADNVVTLAADYTAQQHQFIHSRGSDHEAGTELLTPGNRISPMDIAVIASAGLTSVIVAATPTIRVISTGSELVPPGEPIKPHQIRLSNGPAVIAMLQQHGFANCEHDHLTDEPELLKERIAKHLDSANVVVLSGGVSMGKADYLPEVLDVLGVKVVFHGVSQRPGKPMWFGIGPNKQAVFALPGNPVSTLVCCRQYVIPALEAAAGSRDKPPEFASLAKEVTFNPNLTCYMPVKLIASVGGPILAMPVPTNTSGDFTALSGTDGYVELALEESLFPTGTTARLYRW